MKRKEYRKARKREITATIARKKNEFKKCAEELKKISDSNEEKWIDSQMTYRAQHGFETSWKHKPTELLKKKICYMIALITLIDEEIERRQNKNETTNNG